MDSGIKKKLGEILLDHNFITEEQLFQGIEQQKITPKKLGEILTELGFVTEDKLLRALSTQLGQPHPEPIPIGMSPSVRTKKLGEILLSYNLISKEQLAKAVEEQKKTDKKLGEILTELEFVTEEDLARALSAQLGIPYTDLNSAVVEPEAIDLLTERLARKNLALPLSVDKRYITVYNRSHGRPPGF